MMQRERQRKRKDRQQWLRYRLSATINRHRRCLSPRCRFPATITHSPRKIIPLYLLPSFFFFLFLLPSTWFLAFTFSRNLYTLLSSSRYYRRIFAVGSTGSLSFSVISRANYTENEGIPSVEKTLGPLEEVGEIEDRGRMLNLPTTRSKSDITMENDEGRCHPLRTVYTYIHVYTYVYVDEFSLKDLLRLIDRPRRQVHVSSHSYVLA